MGHCVPIKMSTNACLSLNCLSETIFPVWSFSAKSSTALSFALGGGAEKQFGAKPQRSAPSIGIISRFMRSDPRFNGDLQLDLFALAQHDERRRRAGQHL